MVDLVLLANLLEQATPRPWLLGRDEEGGTHFIAQHGFGGGGPNYYADAYYPQDETDGQLIAAAVNDLPALIAEIERLREVIAIAKHGLEVLHAPHYAWGCNTVNCSGQEALDRIDAARL